MATGKRSGESSRAAHGSDAIAALTADHKDVKALFREFATLRAKNGNNSGEKAELVQRICQELKVHTEIEEEIFYPAVRELISDEDLMDEALVEHAGAKDLVEQLESMDPDDDLYDAKVTVLGEQIDHHVKEEEGQIFPKAKKAKLDAVALGAQMAERKNSAPSEAYDQKQGHARSSQVHEQSTSTLIAHVTRRDPAHWWAPLFRKHQACTHIARVEA